MSAKQHAIEALRDFGIIGAADLAALGAYDYMHRNDDAPVVRIEMPDNKYIEHITKQAGLIDGIAKTVAGAGKMIGMGERDALKAGVKTRQVLRPVGDAIKNNPGKAMAGAYVAGRLTSGGGSDGQQKQVNNGQ